MERSNLVRRQIAFDLGHSFSWGNVRPAHSIFGGSGGRQTGRVEGVVRFAGGGVGGIPVMVNGEQRAKTGGDGRFRLRRLPDGPANLSLDLRGMDPRISVVGESTRSVTIMSGTVLRVEYELRETSYFQGTVVTCDNGEIEPLIDTELVLDGVDGRRVQRTSRLGGFRFDGLDPGRYVLRLAPAAANLLVGHRGDRSWEVDLTGDVTGYVLRLGCD
jgi:hypothetical protein